MQRIRFGIFSVLLLGSASIAWAKKLPDSKPIRESDGNLIFRDAKGTIIAAGNLKLPDRLPAVGKTFKGQWSLLVYHESFPSEEAASGEFQGGVNEEYVWIDLTQIMDGGVSLRGVMKDGKFTGKWFRGSFGGPTEQGSFVATIKA